jgi:glycosyltransferase involved in cell wall biosynthesis
MTALSVVIPFHNEAATLEEIVRRVLAVELQGIAREVILVDDGSTDGSAEVATRLADQHPTVLRCVSLPCRSGKGAAVRCGLREASGDILIVQDADLEYDPIDMRQILDAYKDPAVHAVFGSRVRGTGRKGYWHYYWGGRLVTAVTNLLFGSALTDQPTGYKSLDAMALRTIELRRDGFDFCAELTAKLLRAGFRILEVPVRYHPRRFREGKKLRLFDGFRILWTLFWLRLGGR